MIYTVTTNPSLDYYMELSAFAAGSINRSQKETLVAGGKGINVSIVLARLGADTCALGFAAGHTGDLLCTLLQESGCESDFVRLPSGSTRINVKILCEPETAINGAGPAIDEQSAKALCEKLDKLCADDILVLSGNLQGSGENLYQILGACANRAGAKLVVDAQTDALRQTLSLHPWLIKPNRDELAEFFGASADTDEQVRKLAQELQQMGARNVLVSLGADGAMLLGEDGTCLRAYVEEIAPAISTVGAGDSMVAGFLAGYRQGAVEALRLASAAGTATAFCTVLAEKEDILRLRESIRIEQLA